MRRRVPCAPRGWPRVAAVSGRIPHPYARSQAARRPQSAGARRVGSAGQRRQAPRLVSTSTGRIESGGDDRETKVNVTRRAAPSRPESAGRKQEARASLPPRPASAGVRRNIAAAYQPVIDGSIGVSGSVEPTQQQQAAMQSSAPGPAAFGSSGGGAAAYDASYYSPPTSPHRTAGAYSGPVGGIPKNIHATVGPIDYLPRARALSRGGVRAASAAVRQPPQQPPPPPQQMYAGYEQQAMTMSPQEYVTTGATPPPRARYDRPLDMPAAGDELSHEESESLEDRLRAVRANSFKLGAVADAPAGPLSHEESEGLEDRLRAVRANSFNLGAVADAPAGPPQGPTSPEQVSWAHAIESRAMEAEARAAEAEAGRSGGRRGPRRRCARRRRRRRLLRRSARRRHAGAQGGRSCSSAPGDWVD